MQKSLQTGGQGALLAIGFIAYGLIGAVNADPAVEGLTQSNSKTTPSSTTMPAKSIDLDTLRQQLAPFGWQVDRNEAGDLLLFPGKVAKPAAPVTLIKESTGESIDINKLRAVLGPHGWKVEQGSDGSVLLYPQAATAPVVTESAPSRDDKTQQSGQQVDVGTLREMLEPHGWSVQQDSEGGVILIPGAAKESASVKLTPIEQSPAFDVETLRSLLSPHGWKVEKDADGGVILLPGKSKEPSVSFKEESNVEQQDLQRLRLLLAPHGWHVDQNQSGDLILIPGAGMQSTSIAPAHASSSASVGVVLEPIKDGEISLPVDTWTKAHRLASVWVQSIDRNKDLTVGKIREIHRLYVVSVVADAVPYPLKHQLVIRQNDGHVFPMY